ncbi:tumor suppressor candidate 2 [Aplysia californica]|uniref:Tumor suppressor candidate 2 n=1 Tax=Aplysia californica TaxID=6500 RepID=A0ABM0JEB0_APLCA|nr:tumor suppressor candidate 2 [Aplysia californica]
MGQTASNVTKALGQPLSWLKGSNRYSGSADGEQAGNSVIPRGAAIFVHKRRGSMYFDEDGDLAHEFYCEVTDRKTNKIVMRRCIDNLVPQGEVEYPYPRLHGDLPVIMFDTSSVQLYS